MTFFKDDIGNEEELMRISVEGAVIIEGKQDVFRPLGSGCAEKKDHSVVESGVSEQKNVRWNLVLFSSFQKHALPSNQKRIQAEHPELNRGVVYPDF